MHASPRVQASPPSPEWGTVPPAQPCQGRLCWLGGLGAWLSGTGRRILGSQRGVSSLVFSPECRVLCPQASVVFRDNPAGRNFLKTRLSEEPFPTPAPDLPCAGPSEPVGENRSAERAVGAAGLCFPSSGLPFSSPRGLLSPCFLIQWAVRFTTTTWEIHGTSLYEFSFVYLGLGMEYCHHYKI